jgi:protein-S-isoprenylcysteine O-methyltransferase Ste14
MKSQIQLIISLILPLTVLIVIPAVIENDLEIKNITNVLIGIGLMITGFYMIIKTITAFKRIGKGTLAPWSPTKVLVITGIYRYVRNPMIIGVLTVLIGESIAVMSMPILIWAGFFFIINTVYFILYEEPDLEHKFGRPYLDYKKNVPRWIPRLKPYKPNSANV